MAFRGSKGAAADTARMVQILLSSDVDERFEPLRKTLGLHGDAYREGIFSWKGFLYYKWVLSTLAKRISAVSTQIKELKPFGAISKETSAEIGTYKMRLVKDVDGSRKAAMSTLGVYDGAFLQLTHNSDPGSFRDFLLKSPALFVSLGESVGGISHIVSYWEYRFPAGRPARAAPEEVLEILQEFDGSFVSVNAEKAA